MKGFDKAAALASKRPNYIASVSLVAGLALFLSCGRGHDDSSDGSVTPQIVAVTSPTPSLQDTNRQVGDAAIQEMKRTLDIARSHQLDPPLPNFSAGPGLPPPLGLNSYSVNWHYPTYLLCDYSISENHYDQSNEPAWFEAALLQIRGTGRSRFASSLRWVAVAIHNNAERTDSYEEAYKVAAIFDLGEVFDVSRDLSLLIAHADTDRHPVVADSTQPTPGEQRRWLIVERHAATNRTTRQSN